MLLIGLPGAPAPFSSPLLLGVVAQEWLLQMDIGQGQALLAARGVPAVPPGKAAMSGT